MKKEDDKDSEQKKVMIHDIPDAEKSKDYRNVETQEFSGSQHRNEAPSHHDDDHDEDQYTNDTIPDSLKYDPDKFDIEFVIPKRRSRKQKEIKFFTQCNVVLADVHGVLLKPFHEADRENNVVHHVRHRNGDHFI